MTAFHMRHLTGKYKMSNGHLSNGTDTLFVPRSVTVKMRGLRHIPAVDTIDSEKTSFTMADIVAKVPCKPKFQTHLVTSASLVNLVGARVIAGCRVLLQ